MTHTQGRLIHGAGLRDESVILARTGLHTWRVAEVEYPEDAAELVRRWNAFEPGGEVEQAIEALEDLAHELETASQYWRRTAGPGEQDPFSSPDEKVAAARAAIAALTEGGQS